MLVLSRKLDESLVIDDRIVVRVLEIRGEEVRLGIEAPDELPAHRREIYDAIQQADTIANKSAANKSAGSHGNDSRGEAGRQAAKRPGS